MASGGIGDAKTLVKKEAQDSIEQETQVLHEYLSEGLKVFISWSHSRSDFRMKFRIRSRRSGVSSPSQPRIAGGMCSTGFPSAWNTR